MENINVSNDDIQDVKEMAAKLEDFIYESFAENDKNLVFSAVMSVFVNVLGSNCDSMKEILFRRHIFMHVLDQFILNISFEPENDKEDD
jgi:hypothetical protein